jgi:hypothetical protein
MFGFVSTRLRALAAGLVLTLFAGCPAMAQQDRVPIQADLLRPLEAGRIKVGDPLYAKVQAEWKNPACNLRKGAILRGRIVAESVRSKTQKTSGVALLFESGECDGRVMKPFALTLAAVIAPDPNLSNSLFGGQESQPLSEAVGLTIGGGGGIGPALGGTTGGDLRSLTGAASTAYFVEPPRSKPPKAVLPGQVVGMADVKLNVGNGPEGSSTLSAAKHNLRLEAGSQFVLVPSVIESTVVAGVTAPRSGGERASTSIPNVGEVKAGEAATTTDEDETDVCSPPACSVALTAGESEPGTNGAATTLSVKELGFATPVDREMFRFDHAAAIAYLGAKSLLLTFNPHGLVPRGTDASGAPSLHVVRAVLIDLETMRVQQTMDWRVHDAEQYLWSIGEDRVLIHVGRELRMYGPELKVKQKLTLNGPLAFVRISPSGSYFAIGVVKERHSDSTHREVAAAEDREPEEDVELTVLDASLHHLVTVMRSSREVPPILSDEGEIRIPTIGRNRWRIVEITWTGQRHVLAQVSSSCRPEATSMQPNLLFVVGCDRQSDGKWYRMLRSDGTAVLKGWSSSAELGQIAGGSAAKSVFAVGISEATGPLNAESPFHLSGLKAQYVNVYRVENGHRLMALKIPSFLTTEQTFALSPDGLGLAVLQQDRIAFYSLPATQQH